PAHRIHGAGFAQGVKLISLQGQEKLIGVEKIESMGETDANGDLPVSDESEGEGAEGEEPA
ncbi:MAG TPA: hypothetical protein P5330_01410, partial [Candidatus Competibacteraceae bacterium]|nr:hypothetical protein [Candidatus Competibacteraceae bacterium]